MTENPIKLFRTRAELYPEQSDSDVARQAIEKVIDNLPVAGPVINFVISQFLPPLLERRRDEFFRDLAAAVDSLEKSKLLSVDELARNEMFVTAIVQAARVAIGTHKQEKREALRNALLNIALGKGPHEDEAEMFLHYIEELTPWHIRILACLADSEVENNWFRLVPPENHARRSHIREEWLLSEFPELKGQEALYDQIVLDLYQRGFLSYTGVRGGQTAPPHQQTGVRAHAFIRFISSPL